MVEAPVTDKYIYVLLNQIIGARQLLTHLEKYCYIFPCSFYFLSSYRATRLGVATPKKFSKFY